MILNNFKEDFFVILNYVLKSKYDHLRPNIDFKVGLRFLPLEGSICNFYDTY